jgi:hypothetical protein
LDCAEDFIGIIDDPEGFIAPITFVISLTAECDQPLSNLRPRQGKESAGWVITRANRGDVRESAAAPDRPLSAATLRSTMQRS